MPELEDALGIPEEERAERAKPVSDEQARTEKAAEESRSEAEQEHEPRPRKGGFQKRIDKLTREKYELQQRLAQYEQRDEPNTSGTRREPARDTLREAQRRETQEESASDAAHEERVKKGREKYRDWDAAFEQAKRDNIQISESALAAVRQLPNSEDIAYFLAKNPNVAGQLLTDDQSSVVRENSLAGLAVLHSVERRQCCHPEQESA